MEADNYILNERLYTHQTSFMGAAILENIIVTRSEDSTLFREISREISWFVLTERPLAWDFARNVMPERSV